MFPQFHISLERWRKNTEYGVWVSNQGRIRLIKNKKFLEPRINQNGYCLVFTERGAVAVHRLVAYTWLGDMRNEKYTIDHINSNKRDNSVKNLRWVSEEINLAYAKFTQCDAKIEETKPQTAIEEDENTVIWKNFENRNDAVARGRALLILFSKGLLTIKTNKGPVPNHEALTKMSQKVAGGIALDRFATRIILAAEQNKSYCNLNWYIERKDDKNESDECSTQTSQNG